jgi:hypothetical protein
MVKTPQGSSECAQMWVMDNPNSVFYYFELAKPRWYPIHTWHPNPLANKNDGKVWTQEFDIFWCNIWHKPESGTFHPLFCLQVKFCINITYLSCVHDLKLLLVAILPLHQHGVWWVGKWNTYCVHYHWKSWGKRPSHVLHVLSQLLLENWMPNAIIVDNA